MSNSASLSYLAPVRSITNSDSLDDRDVLYRTALPNSCDEPAMAGKDSQGLNDRPVRGRDDQMA
jgi:hypothetical protein